MSLIGAPGRGLLLEAFDPVGGQPGVRLRLARRDDVAVAGRRLGRLDADGHDVAAGSTLRGRREGETPALLVGDGLVCVQADHHLVEGPIDDMPGQRHGRRGVAALGLGDDIALREQRHGLPDERPVARLGDDVDVGGIDERREPRDRGLQETAAPVEQGQEGLRGAAPAERPQARPATAGEDHGVHADDRTFHGYHPRDSRTGGR